MNQIQKLYRQTYRVRLDLLEFETASVDQPNSTDMTALNSNRASSVHSSSHAVVQKNHSMIGFFARASHHRPSVIPVGIFQHRLCRWKRPSRGGLVERPRDGRVRKGGLSLLP